MSHIGFKQSWFNLPPKSVSNNQLRYIFWNVSYETAFGTKESLAATDYLNGVFIVLVSDISLKL